LAITPKSMAASFDYVPNPAKTGKMITFTSSDSPSPDLLSWDLNGDGQFGDQTGPQATYMYDSPGGVSVSLHDPSDGTTVPLTFNVAGPSASFASFPQIPLPGQQVSFVYSPRQGGLALAWDLDGDRHFDDGAEQTASRAFPAPGTYPVSLAVTDTLDADQPTSTATQPITVRAPDPLSKLTNPPVKPGLMIPFPIVRITGRVGRVGARIKRLTVSAPYGANITVRCRGKGCPFRLSSRTVATVGRTARPSKTIRIRALEGHLLRVRTTVKVYVTKANAIGKFTRFKIRKGRTPLRGDLCLTPGAPGPGACPQT
jgi:PKD domain-containing protein